MEERKGVLGIIWSDNVKMLNKEVLEFLDGAELYVYKIVHGRKNHRLKNIWADWAKEHEIEVEVITPINQEDKFSIIFRNIEILTKSDMLLILWDGVDKDIKFIKGYAELRGKNIKVVGGGTI